MTAENQQTWELASRDECMDLSENTTILLSRALRDAEYPVEVTVTVEVENAE